MTDKIFLRLNDRCALGADDLQWILYRSRTAAPPEDLSPKHWLPSSFVRSTKAILLRHIDERALNDTARLALERLPSTFDAWKAAVSSDAAPPASVLTEETAETVAEAMDVPERSSEALAEGAAE